jgi:hypothetical protein
VSVDSLNSSTSSSGSANFSDSGESQNAIPYFSWARIPSLFQSLAVSALRFAGALVSIGFFVAALLPLLRRCFSKLPQKLFVDLREG